MTSVDLIRHVKLSTARLPLAVPISDAKVFTGRQKPMTEVVFLFAEITTEQGHSGIGFSYSKRAGGPAQYAHAKEIAEGIIGEDPNDIGKLYTKLLWAGASVGRSGVATQAIAAIDIALYDLKAKRAGLPLAKLLGAYRDSVQTYNTSGGFLQRLPRAEVKARATVRWTTASAASRSRSASRTPPRTCAASPASASTWAATCRSWWTPTSSGTAPPRCGWAAGWRSSTWSGSRSRWTPTTPKATPTSPAPWTPRSPPARCWPPSPSTTA